MNIIINRDFGLRLFAMLCLSAIIIFSSDSAFANTTSNDVIGQTLCRLVGVLTGNIAKAIATIAIFVVGAGLFTGKLNWMLALTVSIGIGVVFGASEVVELVSGSSGSCTS